LKIKWLLSCAVLAGILTAGCGGSGSSSSTEFVYGVTDTGNLVKFKLNSPGTISSSVAITGMQGGETVEGIDFRDADNQLYAVGSTSRLYSINTTTGAATVVGGQFTTLLSGAVFGVDFNQFVDRVRITSDTEQSMRINPNNAAVAGVDTALNPAGFISDVAYTPPASSATTLYAIDAVSDELKLIGSVNGTPQSPNGGVLTVVGPLGVNIASVSSFDIDSTTGAVMSTCDSAGTTNLYSVDLATGAATFIGTVGNNLNLTTIALKD